MICDTIPQTLCSSDWSHHSWWCTYYEKRFMAVEFNCLLFPACCWGQPLPVRQRQGTGTAHKNIAGGRNLGGAGFVGCTAFSLLLSAFDPPCTTPAWFLGKKSYRIEKTDWCPVIFVVVGVPGVCQEKVGVNFWSVCRRASCPGGIPCAFPAHATQEPDFNILVPTSLL